MTRIELVTLSLPRIRSADWATSAYEIGCGGRTWTSDLRVMSPTSYQLLHPAISVVVRVGFEPTKRNAADLQSAPFSHSGTSPLRQKELYIILNVLSIKKLLDFSRSQLFQLVAAHGFEPRTLRVWTACSSQLSYAANWSWWPGLNWWPYPYQGYALPTELHQHMKLVAGAGLEPATFGLWARRATNCSTPRYRWWWGLDSNQRSETRQIYSLLPLATREPHRCDKRYYTASHSRCQHFFVNFFRSWEN